MQLASEGMLCGKECYAVDVYTSGCANFMMEVVLTLERESNLWNRKHGLWKREVRKQKLEAALDQDESEIYVCNQLTAQQNFACSLDAAIRQSIWRSRMPELLSIERRGLGEQIFTTVHHYLTTQKKDPQGNLETQQSAQLSIDFTALDEAVQSLGSTLSRAPSEISPIPEEEAHLGANK
ncbi:hypothetical protein CPK_ORF00970 [Chlamydia pneumoniae LPCoLN]|nr:hypothetical protein CPK_ORF00970 [Chlamydia pneumoniae LPCoLN]ETR80355.1 hypothetical protein X556_0322 [Chlamydia pneumoniae B21]